MRGDQRQRKDMAAATHRAPILRDIRELRMERHAPRVILLRWPTCCGINVLIDRWLPHRGSDDYSPWVDAVLACRRCGRLGLREEFDPDTPLDVILRPLRRRYAER